MQQIRKEPKINLNQQTGSHIHTKPSVLMVSTYPPDRDGIALYTSRLENALWNECIKINVAANERDWKRNSLSYIFSIIRKSISSKTDIIHFQLSYFMFGSEFYSGFFPLLLLGLKFLGKRVIITLHDIVRKSNVKNDFLKNYTNPRFLRLKIWAFNSYTRIVCSITDKIIVHSEIARNALTQDYHVPQRKIQIIPHGIDQNSLPSANDLCENKFLTNKNHRIVSYFGLVRHGKGLEDLVRAWKKVKNVNAQLMIIGGKHPTLKDDCYENLIKLVRELGLETSIRFCGYVPNEILPTYFTASDAFVFPYNKWGDVIASSGALSVVAPYLKPIIATDVPAFVHLKNLGAVLVVKKGDIDGLASAIMEVLTDARTRGSLVDKLYEWLPESSWSNVAKKTATVYRELV